MPTDLRRIPGVVPARHWPGRPRHRAAWTTAALAAGYLAVGLYGLSALRSYLRVDVAVRGIRENAVLTPAAVMGNTVSFSVSPTKLAAKSTVTVDDVAVTGAARTLAGNTITWHPGPLREGRHEVVLSAPRRGMGASRTHRHFVVDDTPPVLDVPPLLDPKAICQAMAITGKVEPSAILTVDGSPVKHHNGAFSLHYDRPPAAPLHLVATDPAGNQTAVEVVAPVRYPGGQGIHVTAAAWGYEPLRNGVLSLIDAGLVSAVELDLKDEGGIIGYDSQVPLAGQIGAIRPEYRLKDTVTELKRRGVRVIGRIVTFRDAPLAKWAWANGRRDWVVQTPTGAMLDTYGGFTNPARPEVHRYNIDIAVEAIGAGVDDIMWDYVRRPEGDPTTMVIPGLPGSSANAVVDFLTTAHSELRDRCAYQGAAVFGIAASRPDVVGQDVTRMSRHVDYIAPMLYPSHWSMGEYNVKNPNKQPYDIVKAALADFQAKMAGTGKTLVPWVQDFSLGQPYGPVEVRAQIDAAASLGVGDWLLWNAGVTYTSRALSPTLVKLHE